MGTEETSKEESASARKIWVVNETPDSNLQLDNNLSLLSDALNMDLELVKQEEWIGRYSGDALADDVKGDKAIVIEHRSDETGHYQLGEFLACAQDHNAHTLIWLADNFREEHRAALDWLNRWTPSEMEVYGVEIRSVKEGVSNTKREFVPVVAPASWSKRNESKPIPKIQSVLLRDFFQQLIDDIRVKGLIVETKALTTRYHPFLIQGSSITFQACYEIDGTAWVYIPGGTTHLNSLRREKCRNTIIEELDLEPYTSINWYVSSTGSLGVYREASLYDEEQHDEIRQWMFDYLLKFKKVFNPRMEKIIAELDEKND